MKIAFDLRKIRNPGIGRYMKCLTEAIIALATGDEYLLILPPGAEGMIDRHGPHVQTVICSAGCYSLREQLELPRLLRSHKVDLLHTPHFNLPLLAPCPTVVTIHDVIYLACKHDLPSALGRLYYRAMMKAAVRRADRVVTVSDFSKREIVHHLKANPGKIDVIHSGVSDNFRRVTDTALVTATLSRYGIEGDYILYAGIYKLRKNHAGLLRAFRELSGMGVDAKLVIAGPLAEGEGMLRRLAQELKIADRIVFAGFVPDGDMPVLYCGARVYACPSLYEGFGFTVLEAMACGVPVVCSRETSLPEVAGEAALYADPRDAQGFADALRRAFSDRDLREQLISRGFRNCSRFTWRAAAQTTITAYSRASGVNEDKAADSGPLREEAPLQSRN